MQDSVPEAFQPLLPSSLISNLSASNDKFYIIESLLKNATLQAWQWMFKQYSASEIVAVLKQSKLLKKKDIVLWANYFKIPYSQFVCLQTKSQAGLKNSWVY